MAKPSHPTHRAWMPALNVMILAGTCLCSLATIAPTQTGAKKKLNSADKVKVTATASQPDASGQQLITLKLAIEKGYHLYANPVNSEDFESNRTTVTFKSNGKPVPAKVTYPKGELRKEGQDTLNVYEGETTIQAVVNRSAQGIASPLQVNIQVNACNDKACLPTGHILLQVQ